MKHLFVGLVLVATLCGCEQKTQTPEVSSATGMTSEDVHTLIGMASSPIVRQTAVVPFAEAKQVRLYVAGTGTTAELKADAPYVTLTEAQRETFNSAFSYIEREQPENAVHFGPVETQSRYLFRYVDAAGATVGEIHISFCGEAVTSTPEIFSAPPAKGARPLINYDTIKTLIVSTKVADVTACS